MGNILDSGQSYALVVAPKAGGESTLAWKTANTSDTGVDSLTNGLANSNAVNDASHPAAQFCRSLSIEGYTDWYLPAKNELNVLYLNRSAGGSFNTTSAGYYYSSTEDASNRTYAWLQFFGDGTQLSDRKNGAALVRAVRRVAI
ncbi:DUF1566 domain-containing protein [Devosia sp. 1635]|uniref:Lcl C-terminal domain-containing protein n=1 Tax=Devosia sp. 1635 TaxID=2726066 RepID=UPI00156686E3|nr:DUF1566 domain-containing protein [Devosia sp. 1635]